MLILTFCGSENAIQRVLMTIPATEREPFAKGKYARDCHNDRKNDGHNDALLSLLISEIIKYVSYNYDAIKHHTDGSANEPIMHDKHSANKCLHDKELLLRSHLKGDKPKYNRNRPKYLTNDIFHCNVSFTNFKSMREH